MVSKSPVRPGCRRFALAKREKALNDMADNEDWLDGKPKPKPKDSK